jgi:hypothetical protein
VVVLFAAVSLVAGGAASWRLGRRRATEVEDVLAWGIAAGIIGFLAPLIAFVVVYLASGGGD